MFFFVKYTNEKNNWLNSSKSIEIYKSILEKIEFQIVLKWNKSKFWKSISIGSLKKWFIFYWIKIDWNKLILRWTIYLKILFTYCLFESYIFIDKKGQIIENLINRNLHWLKH